MLAIAFACNPLPYRSCLVSVAAAMASAVPSIVPHGSCAGRHGSALERLKRNNHTMAPVVRVERMPLPRPLDGNAAQNSAHGREKELPSPQQPPPLTPRGLGLLSGPGPGQPTNHVTSADATGANVGPVTAAMPVPAVTAQPHSTATAAPVRKVAGSASAATAVSAGSSHGKKAQRERKLLPCKGAGGRLPLCCTLGCVTPEGGAVTPFRFVKKPRRRFQVWCGVFVLAVHLCLGLRKCSVSVSEGWELWARCVCCGCPS